MHHRVVFIGRRAWLLSGELSRLRADRRITTAAMHTAGDLRVTGLDEKADIVLVQIGRVARRPLAVIETIAASPFPPRCIAIAEKFSEGVRRRLIALGVWGELRESASHDEYLRTILRVRHGRLVYPPHVLDRIATRHGRMTLGPGRGASAAALSARDRGERPHRQ